MSRQTAQGFEHVQILPRFTTIKSRKDVDPSSMLGGLKLALPVISSNMATVTEYKMANAMNDLGAVGALHRFMSVAENVKQFKKCNQATFISLGVADSELERFEALYDASARYFIIDVAHGAQQQVVDFTKKIRELKDDFYLMVGNFATAETIKEFASRAGKFQPDSFKVGLGSGAVCSTKTKTGVHVPQLSAVMDAAQSGKIIISDGGVRTPSDVVKALAAGAHAVMIGGLFAATTESPGKTITRKGQKYKVHHGSAFLESWSGFKTSEGIKTELPYKGSVVPILKDIEGGLRSAMTYIDARNLTELREKATFIEVA